MTERTSRIGRALQDRGYDVFLAWSPVTLGYLTGFFEKAHERFMTLAIHESGECKLICPALAVNQAERVGITGSLGWRDGEDPLALFSQATESWDIAAGIIAVDPEMPSRHLLALQHLLPKALFKDGSSVIADVQRAKDASEIDAMKRAAVIADQAWIAIQPELKAGITEADISDRLSSLMKDRGGKPTFAIVAAGPNGAEPHHLSDSTPLAVGDTVILDFGCEVDGYQSDITRTIHVGPATVEESHVYEVVYRAHLAGRDAIHVGVTGAEADAAARKVIEDAGFGEYFNHRLGHGIGMNGHEAPNLVNTNQEPLRAGDCFSIEPGIYLPGRFGVRIENIYTLTEDGPVSFNDELSPTLMSL